MHLLALAETFSGPPSIPETLSGIRTLPGSRVQSTSHGIAMNGFVHIRIPAGWARRAGDSRCEVSVETAGWSARQNSGRSEIL